MKTLEQLRNLYTGDETDFQEYLAGIISRLPKRYQKISVKDLPENINEYCYQPNERERKSLYLFAKSGTGKTHYAYTVAFLARANKITTEIVNANKLLNEIQQSFNSPKTFNVSEINERASFLVIDDLGAHKVSEWSSNLFYLLINERYEAMQPTLFTSNLSLDEVSELLGDRITSRIAEMCSIIEVQGDDKRLK